MTDSTAETPTITDMTLEISHLHQRILKWKADMESQVSKASNEAKKAQDDRKFASQDYELKIKQLNERYGNLTKGVSEEMNAKVKELFVKQYQLQCRFKKYGTCTVFGHLTHHKKVSS